MRTHYEILQLPASATHEEVRRAYHDQARMWHPDRFSERTPADAAVAETTMRLVNEAWRVLGDNGARARYDATLLVATEVPARTRSASSAGSSKPSADDSVRIDPRLLDPEYLRDRAQARYAVVDDQHSRIMRMVPWLGLAVLMVGIFIFTAYASRPSGNVTPATVPGPPIPYASTSCLRVLSEGLQEVPNCNGTNDGRIIGARLNDGVCPRETTREVPYQDLWICLLTS